MSLKNLLLLFTITWLMACESVPEQAKNQDSDQKTVQKSEVKNASTKTSAGRTLAKYEPADGKVILFVGQEMEALGGLEEFKDGYLDHFKRPAGWTTYTNLTPGENSFGFINKGLDGIWSTADWGDSKSNMSLQVKDKDYENMAVAIGLSLVGHTKQIAKGERDDLIIKMGNYLKSLAPRPVFLRIGYEFDGHSWNHYDLKSHKASFRRIKDKLDSLQVTNVAYVWQSTGWVSDQDLLEEWYPGDEYVDWCGYSFFSRWKEQEMIEFARKKGKPVFIAEASPLISDHMTKFDGNTKETILSKPAQAQEAWDKWFTPFFKTINENPDVVKAISYINCHWKNQKMWKDNPSFKRIDARLQTNKMITEKWKQEIGRSKYIHSSATLYADLQEHK